MACSNTVTPNTPSCSSSQSCVLTQFLFPICSPPCCGTTREDCCPLCGDTSVAAQPLCVLPGNYKCYYCQWLGGTPLFSGLFFCHEAKVLYSSSNGGLNSPDSVIHCLVTLCEAGFVPPFYANTINFWFSLFALWRGLRQVFSPTSDFCYFYSSQK